jgi:hypothetical protein
MALSSQAKERGWFDPGKDTKRSCVPWEVL